METQTITVDTTHTAERVFGFSITEDSSADASFNLRAGSASGQIVVGPIELAADESALIVLPKAVYWSFPGGCHVEEVSGSVVGEFYWDGVIAAS